MRRRDGRRGGSSLTAGPHDPAALARATATWLCTRRSRAGAHAPGSPVQFVPQRHRRIPPHISVTWSGHDMTRGELRGRREATSTGPRSTLGTSTAFRAGRACATGWLVVAVAVAPAASRRARYELHDQLIPPGFCGGSIAWKAGW